MSILCELFYSVDPFSRKDWYDVMAPGMFQTRNIGKTIVNRTQGTSKSFFVVCASSLFVYAETALYNRVFVSEM